MIYRNVELHNVAELTPVPELDAVRLQRVPERVRTRLNPGAQKRMLQPDNMEIRFLSDKPVKVTLSAEGTALVTIFYGDFDGVRRILLNEEPQTIEVTYHHSRVAHLAESRWTGLPFSPRVYRLILGGGYGGRDPVRLHRIEGENIRPPTPEELPRLRYLAYGTSITQGFYCENPCLNYAAQTARNLGADLINLGSAGSAYCEAAIADHIAERDDWDIASLALSVNMQGFLLDEFDARVSYMVNRVAGANPDRLVVCITLYPYLRDLGLSVQDSNAKWQPEQGRQVLREAARNCPHPNVHLLEGKDILKDITGLSADLIHPSDMGMVQMGRNLAEAVKKLM